MAASDAAWNEQDSKEDNRRPLSTKACFHVPDTTLNVMVGTTGNILMALNEGGLHYLFAGARANVGILAGRYMFEVRILELLSQAETGVQLRTPVPKHVLRVGFSTARSTPIMGDNEESICFDSDGGLLFNRKRIPLLDAKYGPESTVAVVLNLDSDSPNMNTVSLYRDGQRLADPQMLPESLQGKALFPTLTYKNMNLHVNFGPAPYVPLPFKCKMIQEAATDDVEVVTYPPPEDGRYEVLFPVCLPGEGTFHWADWFLERNPHYVELSERMVVDWASRSGIYRPKVASVKASNDRPEMNFGMPHLDEGTVKQILQAAAATQQRDILFLEVRNNLLKEERKQSVVRFRLPHFKRVAKVMMGLPSSDYLEYVYEQLRKEKQEKADAEFELQRQHATQQKLLEMQEKQAEWAQQREAMQQEAAAAAEAGEGEAAPPAAAPAEEEAKKTTEMEVDGDGEPPRVELTEEEKKHWHKRLDAVPDLAPSALSACFADFSLPDPSEGFDEVLYPWQSPVGVNDYLRQWIQEHKLTTRIEDLQPSEWFKEKWQKWQKDLQGWHAKHVEYKDPVKRAALLAAKAKAKEEANDKTQEAEDGEKNPKRRKLSPENGEKGDETKDEAKETAKTDETSKEAVVEPKQDAPTEAKEETKEEAKEDLEKFTVPQLKDKLRAAGLMVSGNKADLIKRLQAAKEAEANKTSAEPPPEQEGEKKEEKPDAPTAEAGKEEEKKDEAQDMQVDQEGEKKEEKGEEAAAGEADKEGDKKEEAESKEKEAQEEEDNVDYLKELDEEIEQADNDVFEIEDVTDIGTGEPLFFNFGFEDWALLSLRFELHLLAHAFLHDCGDPERSGIYPDHLLFYYNRYYKKGLNPKNYGVEGVEELVTLVRDSIVVCPPKVIESMLSPELEDNDIFVKLTEEARRERLRRLDAGDESARLKFATGSQSSAKASSKAPVIIPGKGVTKGEALPQQTLLQQQQRQQQVRQQMQMATAAAGPMGPGPMVPGPMQPGPMQRPWGPPAAAFGVPLAQQRAMMARQPWG